MDCANCCKTLNPTVTIEDISNIANHLNLSPEEIKTKYLQKHQDGSWEMNQVPCPFLAADNACSIYSARPKDCREYPHTDKKGFNTRRYMHSDNTLTCPAVFDIVERLKMMFRY